jgi:hypothetical protein
MQTDGTNGQVVEVPVERLSADAGTLERARENAQRMSEWAKDLAERVRASVGREVQEMRDGRDARDTRDSRASGSSTAQVMMFGTPGGPPMSFSFSSGPGMQWTSSSSFSTGGDLWLRSASRGTPVTTPLATKDIEGVRANGELSTWTIEAGKIGNEKPIRITREVWTSPDLMLTVQSKDIDPREGEHHYRLTNLSRQAPDPDLFKVPADFAERKR